MTNEERDRLFKVDWDGVVNDGVPPTSEEYIDQETGHATHLPQAGLSEKTVIWYLRVVRESGDRTIRNPHSPATIKKAKAYLDRYGIRYGESVTTRVDEIIRKSGILR